MPVAGKGSSSNFAAAAKVLFESAQKTGAVKPLEKSGLEYAQQLKKLQSQSKKRGGSLGGVSYKVSEFLAAQRAPTPVHPPPRRPDVTLARKVPLIDLPTRKSKGSVDSDKAPVVHESAAVHPEPPTTVHSGVNHQAATQGTTITQHTAVRGDGTSHHAEEVAVIEDTPLFQTRPLVPPSSSTDSFVVRTATPAEKDGVEASAGVSSKRPSIKPPAPTIGLPVASTGTAAAVDAGSVADPSRRAAVSMDLWERQRELEIERLQQKQEELERRRLAAQLEGEHKTLGAQWVEQRTIKAQGPTLTAEQLAIQNIQRATHIDDMLRELQQITNTGSKSGSCLSAAVSSVACLVSRMKPLERDEAAKKLFDALDKGSVPQGIVKKARLTLTRGDEFLASFHELAPAAKEGLGKSTALKAVPALMQHGQWLEALEILENSRKTFTDRNSQLALSILLHTRQLDVDAKAAVRSHVVRALTSSGSLSKHAKLALALSEDGPSRRNSLQQLAAGADADENIYAQLILRTSAEDLPALLAEMDKRGLNKDDPVVLKSLLFKTLDPEDSSATFREIEQQTKQIGLRPFHYLAAAKAAQLHSDTDTVEKAVGVLLSGDATYGASALRKLLPVLYEKSMFQEIVALADHFGRFVPLRTTFPRALAFVNESLERVGRPALSEVRVKHINYIPSAAKPQKDTDKARVAPSSTDVSSLTEKMLVYAKERQWVQALEAVQALNTAPSDDAAAVTLIYNCALSSAVEQPDALKATYATMRERNVAVNATTINTILSSYSKFGNWKDAIEFFDSVPSATRDSNTFLVQLSLLGKHNLWVEASAVYEQMRKAVNKPPASMFAVAIGATSNHNWSVTLRMFQDMLKLHGANVKENVVNQVVRCLEQNNRTVELGKLEMDLAKRKKKGKK